MCLTTAANLPPEHQAGSGRVGWLLPAPAVVVVKEQLTHLTACRCELSADDYRVGAVLPVYWHGVEGKVQAVIKAL